MEIKMQKYFGTRKNCGNIKKHFFRGAKLSNLINLKYAIIYRNKKRIAPSNS